MYISSRLIEFRFHINCSGHSGWGHRYCLLCAYYYLMLHVPVSVNGTDFYIKVISETK
jgi:hypothetical protein